MKKKENLYRKIINDVAVVVKHKIDEFYNSQQNPMDQSELLSPNDKIIDDLLLGFINNFTQKYNSLKAQEKDSMFESYVIRSRDHMFYYGVGSVYQLREQHKRVLPTDPEITVDYIKRTFGLKDFQIKAQDIFGLGLKNILMSAYSNNPNLITIAVAEYQDNKDAIIAYMEANGYTRIREIKYQLDDGRYAFGVMFVVKQRPNVQKEIIKNYPKLYHISASRNYESICKNGLIAKEHNGEDNGIYYPKRVYFFTDYDTADYVQQTQFFEETDLYEFDTKDIASQMEIFYDPLYGKSAVYVEHNVSPDLIKEIYEE